MKNSITKIRNPITINEPFRCGNCGKNNPKSEKSCRNHCKFCLYSMHVDEHIPGDRLSKCRNFMEPVLIIHHTKKGYQILHQCLKCDKKMVNKIAPDDNQELIIRIMQKQNMNGSMQH